MALTNEELEARIVALEEAVDNIKQCYCDPSNYASKAEFDKLSKTVTSLGTAVGNIKSCTCDPSKYASAEEFSKVKSDVNAMGTAVANHTKLIGTLPEGTEATTIVGYVEEKTNVPTHKLPFTAAEIEAKLSAL